MLATTLSAVILVLFSSLLAYCNIYRHYGCEPVVVLQLDTASTISRELAANVPSIRSRFRPGPGGNW